MTKILYTIIFIFLLFYNVNAQDLSNYFDISTIEESAKKNAGIDFSDLYNEITSGTIGTNIANNILNLFVKEVKENIHSLKLICVICLIIGIFRANINNTEKNGVNDLISFIGQIIILSIVTVAFKEMIHILKEIVISLIDIMDSSLPLMVGIVSLSGNVTYASGIYTIIAFVTEKLFYVIDGVVIPLISMGTLLKIVNLLSKQEMLSKMCELFHYITINLIKIGGIGFVSILLFGKIGGNTIESFLGNSTKSVVKMIPFVGNIYGNGIDVASNALKTLSSGVSLSIIIVLIVASILPMIKIIAITFLYKFIAALIEPVTDKEIVEIIDSIGEGGKLIFSTLFSILFMFIMTNIVCMNFLGG